MKNLLLLSFLLLIMGSCTIHTPQNPIPTPTNSVYDPIPVSELNYFIYQIGDTISFVNSTGKILNYECTARHHYAHKVTPPTGPPLPYDSLIIYLKCLTDTTYNISMDIALEELSLLLPYNSSFFGLYGIWFDTTSTPCKLSTYEAAIAACFDSMVINNKKYYNVSMVYYSDPYIQHSSDTMYYNQQYGILKYCIALDKEIWVKR